MAISRGSALVRAARTYCYYELETLWDAAVQDHPISAELRTAQRIANLLVSEHCVSAVDLLYRLAGSSAIFHSSPLERCFRDVHTAAQHFQVQENRWETTGRVLLWARARQSRALTPRRIYTSAPDRRLAVRAGADCDAGTCAGLGLLVSRSAARRRHLPGMSGDCS
jgi:hypothetical protein